MNKITLTYKIKDFVKAIKLSFLCFSKRIKWAASFCLGEKKKKNEICAMICGIKVWWTGKERVQKQEGKVDVLSRDSRKDCEGQSEISRFLCDFTKSKWIMWGS